MNLRNKQQRGFSLIEIMVVVSIIGFLASVTAISLSNGRVKARDGKRIGDMSQMVKALELYFLSNKGYPAATTAGVPDGMVPSAVASLPLAPNPPDGTCNATISPSPAPQANQYYYEPQGTPTTINGTTVYPSYRYYFCLGNKTGDLGPGLHIVSPTGIK